MSSVFKKDAFRQRQSVETMGPSVDGEHIALDLMAQLSLQITQLFLEDGQCRHDDVLWPQGAA